MQNKRDAEQKGCRTGRIHYRRGAGQEECRTEGIQNRRDEGQEGCSRFRNIYQFDLMVLERRSEMSVFNFVHIYQNIIFPDNHWLQYIHCIN